MPETLAFIEGMQQTERLHELQEKILDVQTWYELLAES